MSNNLTDEQLEDMGLSMVDIAEVIFKACGYPKDFCHQTGTVFGGWNRIWLTSHGWVADRTSCTPEFLAKFDAYMARPASYPST